MATLLPIPVDSVELKVTFPDPARALAAFGQPAEPTKKPRQIWFLDVRATGGSPRLLAHDVVLRVRRNRDGDGDTTAKLRPVDPDRLTGRWALSHSDHDDYGVEYDWARVPVLAASQGATLGARELAALLGDTSTARDAFSARQRAFVAECGPAIHHPFRGLDLAGPIDADRWEFPAGPFEGDLGLRA